MQTVERAALLGPVVEQYLRLLDSHIQYLDDGETSFLFMTRAGVRIREAYITYLDRLNRKISSNAHIFWSSRLLICKGISNKNITLAVNTIGREFESSALENTISALMLRGANIATEKSSTSIIIPSQPLHDFINSSHEMAVQLRSYLSEQSSLFEEYLKTIIGSAKRVVIIDTGWAGTSQNLLAKTFPEIEWVGLYFGWMNDAWDLSRNGSVRGLIFNSETYIQERPETAIALHRHMIESLFEPNAPSVEELIRDSSGRITAIGGELLSNENFDESTDPNYYAVLKYLSSCSPDDVKGGIGRYQKAIKELAVKLSTPNYSDALMLAGKHRSADFGRSIQVPVLLTKEARITGEKSQERIARSLWPEGQIALEYSPETALRVQKLRLKNSVERDNCCSRAVTLRPHANQGRVAIITRTKDRPLLLKRAAASVASQSFTDYVWVVVNDGGDPEVVAEVIRSCDVPIHQILFCSNDVSVGMEAASNIGIHASKSEFLVIHDDDDSWHCDFLRRTVAFLEAKAGQKYGGVITHSTYISEEIDGERVIEWGRWPYQDWVQHIQLSELIVENFFPPIAFVCRRPICEEIGYFDEKLPVLGDWDFAIRFLLEADIGVIPENLAYYHHRDRGNAGTYSNSVVGGVAKHIEYNSIVRNKFIRGANQNSRWSSVAALMAQGYKHRDLRIRLQQHNQPTTEHPRVIQDSTSGGGAQKQLSQSDLRWCMLMATRAYYQGFLGIFHRLIPFPSIKKIENKINSSPLPAPPDFDDEAYLKRYPDIAHAVRLGKFSSGFEHYIKYGNKENRFRPTFVK